MTTNISFALEYSLGHVTHGENLKAALKDEGAIHPTYFEIPYDNTPLPAPWSKIGPIHANWTARASIVAYRSIKSTLSSADAAFFHTQVTSIFSAGLMRRLPSIVSLDATPVQYDALGSVYNHAKGSSSLEQIKKRLNVRAFSNAKALITWSQWAKNSLTADYGIDGGKISVIPPGIDLRKWSFSRSGRSRRGIRFLFVGADFSRKGGETLLTAYRLFAAKNEDCSLDIVTKDSSLANLPDGVRVYNGLRANTPELLERYAQADVFVFPTKGDCLPLAVMEAMGAGLPVITTDVGALSEAVTHGVTGLVVEQGDSVQLAGAMQRLADDPDLRSTMSTNARQRAEDQFDGRKNYRRLVEALLSVSGVRRLS